jgi:hypothetical protein
MNKRSKSVKPKSSRSNEMNLLKYSEVIKYLNDESRERHLLLGNGFSMTYDKDIFSYNALSEFLFKSEDKLLKKLFEIIKTSNFETIMRELDTFYQLANEFLADKKMGAKIATVSESLKDHLIRAVSQLHPDHVFNIPAEKSKKCLEFLKDYLDHDGHIFTTNYDLLLYWVLMRHQDEIKNIVDGFGKERLDDIDDKETEPEYGELEWGPNSGTQHIHYLHGALHIFDAGVSIHKEIYDGKYLIDNIKSRMAKKEYPVFVTAGDGSQKLEHILHNQYLDFCYKKLCKIKGSLVVFGFGFGKYDGHIIDAINKAHSMPKESRLWSVYIGVHSLEGLNRIRSIQGKFRCKVKLFDAKSVSVWGP